MRLHWDVGERRRGVSLEPPSSLLSSAGKLPAKPRKPAGEGKAETPGPAENQGPAVNLPLPDRAQNTGSNSVGDFEPCRRNEVRQEVRSSGVPMTASQVRRLQSRTPVVASTIQSGPPI